MPEGFILDEETVRDLDFSENAEYKCFAPDEYETVTNIVVDYRWFWFYAAKRDLMIRNYELQIGKLQTKVDMWKLMSNRQDESSEFTRNLLAQDRAMKRKRELGSKVTMYAAIGVALVEMVIIGALAFK